MNRAESGREQLESAIVNFPNFIPDNIDLTAFMSDEQKHRIKSAYDYKDKLLELISGGGERGEPSPWLSTQDKFEFRESELTIWSGYKGHGKSLVISQVLEKFISNNKKVFIISPEFPAHRVLHRMLIQSLSIECCVPEMATDWLKAVSNNLWIYDQQSSLKPSDVPALCRYAVKVLGVDHILIDSLMKCGISPDDYGKQKHLVDSIQQIAHTTKAHIHLVAHGRKGGGDDKMGGLHDVKGASEVADMAENVIIVWRNKEKEMGAEGQKEAPDCIVKVEAQRNGDGWVGKIPLYFDKRNYSFRESIL
jgi:twinkle protein